MNKTLFIFRRDLRLEDNTALHYALQHSKEVILAFIFTPEQIEQNSYRSNRCIQFMIESLVELEEEIKSRKGRLYLFYGEPHDVVGQCVQLLKIDGVIFNRDYTPYSIRRDQLIEETCTKYNIACHSFEDALLHPIDHTLKSNGLPYTIFTPFYHNAAKLEVRIPSQKDKGNFFNTPIGFAKDSSLYDKILPKREVQQRGGRKAALEFLKGLPSLSNYSIERDFPAKNSSSHLSPHLKFTTCSPREVYYAMVRQFGPESELVRSLYWRDFFTSIAFHFPKVFQKSFKDKFNAIEWSEDRQVFQRWCEGQTGFPIVDAGMRELNQTGFMHNRVRMIAASFLVKDLHINWRWGEKYFAQTLIDYDPAVNNGNWQWAASTGCDAQPYFRIFNPWTQGLKFDGECAYIKKWIPELSLYSSKMIHQWHLEKNYLQCCSYPKPLVDHSIETKKTLRLFNEASETSL